ncbi:hypothetical protein AB9M62_28005 [Bacillales bacterium AN1005]
MRKKASVKMDLIMSTKGIFSWQKKDKHSGVQLGIEIGDSLAGQ